MLEAIDHLVSLGHKSFGVISGPLHVGSAVTTRDAFLRCLAVRGLKADRVMECNYRVDGGTSAVRALLNEPTLPTALLCGNDLIAIGAISALDGARIRVPQDMSVLGVDDIFFARLACPPLTTIHVPGEDLGRLGFQVLEGMCRSPRRPAKKELVETHLVIRKSTAPP